MVDVPSAAPQARKLGLKAGLRVRIDNPSPGWSLQDPPDDLEYVGPADPADVIIAFVRTAAELAPKLVHLGDAIFPDGNVWIAWPRKAGGHVSDVNENLVRAAALALGLVDNKVAAIDADWSGLRLCWRRELRKVNRIVT